MAVPDFSSFLFRDHVFGVSGKGQDRFMVLPIDNRDSGPVGISRWLNAQIALVALSKLDHPLICFPMLGMVHVSVDRCENDCVVGGPRRLRDERHDSILFVCAPFHSWRSWIASALRPCQFQSLVEGLINEATASKARANTG